MLHARWPRSAAFWTLDRLRGGPVASQLRDVRSSWATPQRIPEQSADRLRLLLEHATRSTPYFRQFSGAHTLAEFPVTRKQLLRERYDDFFSEQYSRDQLVPVMTSGSYGTPFTYHLTREKKARIWAEVLHFSSWLGYLVGTRHACTRVKPKSPLKLFLQNEVLINPTHMDECWLAAQRAQLRRKALEIVISYPSSLHALAEYCHQQGDRPERFNLRGIVTYAETLLPETRALAERVFGCPVVTRYSTEEFGILAHQHPETRRIHLNTVSFVFEFLQLDADEPAAPGEPGRIVVTDLFSYAMPLIRYETGDIGVVQPGTENDPLPLLERIEGRQIECVYDTVGVRMSPLAISAALRDLDGVMQYQFVQQDRHAYLLRFVVLPTFSQESLVRERLLRLLGHAAQLTIEYVDSIPTLRSGKRPYIINEMARRDLIASPGRSRA